MFAARKTDGAATAAAANYIEDVFSTYLYTGNGSARNIQNGISFGTTGGLIGGSVSFDGSGDYMEVADQSLFNLGNSAYTIEFWVYPTSFSAAYVPLAYQWSNSGGTRLIVFIQNTDATYTVYFNNAGNVFTSTNTVTLNQWNHIALVRSSNTFTLYINGTSGASAVAAITYSDSSFPIVIGASYDNSGAGVNSYFGSISNLRVAIGNAVYTANFLPPTAPLTAVSGTRLLTCQTPNPVLDYSGNNFPITVVGAVAQTTGGPFTEFTQNKPGMVWFKSRSAATDNKLFDSVRGPALGLSSNSTAAQTTETTGLTSFNSNGFTIGSSSTINQLTATYASWTFRKQAKFFDVVTYTGNGANRTIAHNLGSVPGCIIVKRTDSTSPWSVYHRSLANTQALSLDTTAVAFTGTAWWNSTTPTDTVFSLGTATQVNANGGTYVAYLFAHDAGGFGAAGTDNVISCGSYTGNGSSTGPEISLGYEPQFILIKRAVGGVGDWLLVDNMRGWTTTSDNPSLYSNLSSAEANTANTGLTSTGFKLNTSSATVNASGSTYIYIAIRRGPMKTPTSGTSVYEGVAYTGNAATQRQIGSTVLLDALLLSCRSANSTGWSSYGHYVIDRLRGDTWALATSLTTSNSGDWSTYIDFDKNIGWDTSSTTDQNYLNSSSSTFVSHAFSRAPGFFDVVCDTGTASAHTITHGLTVVPELMIRKKLNSATNSDWVVWHTAFTGTTKYLYLNSTAAEDNNSAFWTSTAPTSTVFSVGTGSRVNNTGDTYVTYLFASVNGVSKVGSYTGNGSSQTINCGFAAGARFILIKRTSSTGDWYVWDTARGIVSGNDPRLSLNTTAAEVTTDDSIDPDNSGFIVNQLAATNINVNAATYIYLAIA